MSETVRGNKASVLRSRIPRFKDNRADLWAYTSPQPAPFSALAKDREHKSDPETISQDRARSSSCTPLIGPGSLRTRPTEAWPFQCKHNWMQALKAEQRNLEQMQNVFMNKIRTMGNQGRKLPGSYKFVVMVCNDNRELVEDSSDNSVDKNEKRLTEELALRDEIISELKAKLQLSEELVSQKTLQLAESQIKENARQYLEAEISSVKNICDRMCSRLEETDIKLKDATEQVKRHAGSMTNMSELQNQLKTAADWELDRMKAQLDANHQLLAERSVSILKLQQSELKFKEKYGNTLQDLTHKNTLVNLLNNELDAKNEQVSQVMKALKDKQDAVAKQQNTIRLLEEQAARSALMRTKHEERMAAMLLEIAQLKQCLSNHAHVMVANIEDMEAVRAQHQTFPQQDQ